jgi:hypothetical protein
VRVLSIRPRPPKLATLAAALDAKVAYLRLMLDEVDCGDQVSSLGSRGAAEFLLPSGLDAFQSVIA